MINDSGPNLIEQNVQELTNFSRNLCQCGPCGNGSCNLEQGLKNTLKKVHPDAENKAGFFINIDKFVHFLIEECLQNCSHVNLCFASRYLHLLIRDSEDGIKLNVPSQDISINKIEQFLLTSLGKLKNPVDATVCCMKISYYCKNSKELNLHFVKEKYELIFKNKLKQLVNSILQYPENSSDQQLQEMFLKMQVFVITNYQIGYPENNVLLKKCRQCLNSILGKGDIQKYVLRKRYHRLEYLQKLGATAAGIIIFNNQGPEGDKENIRNNLKMAKCNTKDSFQQRFDRVLYLKQKVSKVMLELIEINVQEKCIYYLRPRIQIRELNKFVVLFEVYTNNLEKAKTVFEKTQYLMEVDQKKFDCVVEKINEILKYRSAIETEMIFPHFVYLSEIWNSLLLYLNHVVEINKINDNLDDLLSQQLENKFNELLEDLSDKNKYLKNPLKYSFEDIINASAKCQTKLNMLNIKTYVKDYCALTMALTGGFLVPSQLEKKLCENIDFRFGFCKMEYAKFAERHFRDFVEIFRISILTCSDIIILFELDDEILQQDFELVHQSQAKRTSTTQTEVTFSNETLPKTEMNEMWNVWDFHRHTIKLANIRTKQTHSTQSNLSYSKRNAQNQCDRKLNNATQKQ